MEGRVPVGNNLLSRVHYGGEEVVVESRLGDVLCVVDLTCGMRNDGLAAALRGPLGVCHGNQRL